MNGDFTRLSFRPKKHYSGVLMQQGRVQLDSDWNELVQIMQHRMEQQAIDTIGACGVPKPPAGHAAPFTLTARDDGSLHLEPGRIYVDGMLCELEPDAVQDLPTVSLPAAGGSTTVLVFLDVWRRHVSAIEDGGLRESALGGPDTTTRMQTAWAVRINAQPTPSRNCDATTDLPPASTGTLTTHQAAATATTPCIVGAKGGYTGLENRLYRVEIHRADAGTQPAAFKWSRDNNAIGLAVTDFPTTDSVTVSRLGRDDVARFLHHWIEVIGDHSESVDEAGTLAQVISIDPIGGILQLDRDVSRHKNESNPRVRRWDMPFAQPPPGGGALPLGAIPITAVATPAMLDPSVAVSFDGPAGGGAPHFQAGDYWTFTARTAEGVVEPLTKAPPHGIQHHYCKLGWVTLTETRDGILVGVLPCSHPFPPLTDLPPAGGDGCCVRLAANNKVDLGARLQLAVDELARTGGGCVCVPPGVQILERPIKIVAPPSARITICGCGGTSRLVYLPRAGVSEPAFLIADGQSVVLREFGLIAAGASALVSEGKLSDVTIEACCLINLPVGPSFAPCIKASEQARLTMRHCDLVGGVGIFESADLSSNYPKGLSVHVQECRFLARLIGAYLELPQASSFIGCEIIGVQDSDWLVLNATASGLAASALNLERLVEGLFDAVRTDLASTGYHLPVGLGLVAGSGTTISDCEIRAGVGVSTLSSANEKLYRNRLYGLVGVSALMTNRMDVVDNRMSTVLHAILATGQTQWWRARDNAIFNPPPWRAIVFGRATAGDRVIRASLQAFVSGLDSFKAGPDAVLISGFPKPTAWPGASALLEALKRQYDWYRSNIIGGQDWGLLYRCHVEGNVIAAQLSGVSVEPHVEVLQVRIAGNRIDGPLVAGIRLRGLATGGPYGVLGSMVSQVEGNHLQLKGTGIDVGIASCAVSANHVDVAFSSYSLPDLHALQDLAGVLSIPNPVQAPPFGLNNYSVLRLLFDQAYDAILGGLSSQQRQGLTSVLTTLRDALTKANLNFQTYLLNQCLNLLNAATTDDVAVANAFSVFSDVLIGGLDNVGIRLGEPMTQAVDNTIGAGVTARGGILIDVQPQIPQVQSTLLEVCDNRISGGAGHGVEIRNAGTAMRINENTVDRMAGNGITTIGTLPNTVQGIEVSGNRIVGCRSTVSSGLAGVDCAGVLVDGGNERRIVDNTITGTAPADPLAGPGVGISVYGGAHVMIRGNTVTQNGTLTNLGGGVTIEDCTESVVVADNQLVDNPGRALHLYQPTDLSTRVSVTGNTFKGARQFQYVSGLALIYSPDVIFSHNHIVYAQQTQDTAIWVFADNLVSIGNMWNQDGSGYPFDYYYIHTRGGSNVLGNVARPPHVWPHYQDSGQNVEHNVHEARPSIHSGVGAPGYGTNPANPRHGDLYLRVDSAAAPGYFHIYYFDGILWMGIA